MTIAKGALLKHLKVKASLMFYNPNKLFALTFNIISRSLSDEVKSLFLDKSEITDRVISVVKNLQKIDSFKVTPNAHFKNDLGLDSLDTVEIIMALEEEFGFDIPDNETDKISTINHAVEFIASHPLAK